MALDLLSTIEFDPTGDNIALDVTTLSDFIDIYPIGNTAVTLTGDVTITFSGTPLTGQNVLFKIANSIDLNGHGFSINGINLQQWQFNNTNHWMFFIYKPAASAWYWFHLFSMDKVGITTTGFSGVAIQDGTTLLKKLENVTAGQIIMGNSLNIPTATAVSGDITISSSGVTAISAGVIVNADISASAAIARTKLANGNANQVVINNGSGVLSSEATLSPVRGGLGTDASASTGFVTFSSGTASVSTISETITLPVSFEAGSLGGNKVKMAFAGTVTGIYAYATSAIAGTDNGTITPKNNAGTTMTSGVITFTAGDARGTAQTSSPSANNTFSAGDVLDFTTAKTTAGGTVLLSITVTRSN